jgi:methylamine utilization protein MauE
MTAVALAARVVLATALLVASVAKLRSRDIVGVAGVELLVVVWLTARPWSAHPALAAVVLFTVFTVVVVRDLLGGSRQPCRCFGEFSDRPVSTATLVRNGWLVALAIVAAGTRPGPSIPIVVVVTAGLGLATVVVIRRA